MNYKKINENKLNDRIFLIEKKIKTGFQNVYLTVVVF